VVKFIHTSDWQLGMRRDYLPVEAQARFTEDRISAIGNIGRIAAESGSAFVVVAGDVFEDNAVDRQVVLRALDAMKAAQVQFYLLPGNHDPLNDGSVYRSPKFLERLPANVAVIESSDPIAAAPGVQIIGAPWFSKHPLEDLVSAAIRGLQPERGTVRIVVGHGATDAMGGDNPAIIHLPNVEAAFADTTIHYLALGDRHSATGVGTSGRAWYSGAPEPTDYVEVDPGHVLFVDLDKGSRAVEKVRIGKWHFIEQKFQMNGPADLDALDEWLESLPEKPHTILKLSFEGTLHLTLKLRLDSILEHAGTLFGALEYWDRHMDLAVMSDESDFGALGLTGFAEEALHELQEASRIPGPSAELATDALALLYRLAEGGA
jgi:DNA repair exonuclease SbcCD nuclease subunit